MQAVVKLMTATLLACCHSAGTAAAAPGFEAVLESWMGPLPPRPAQRGTGECRVQLRERWTRYSGRKPEMAAELDALLPSVLDNAFKGNCIGNGPGTITAAPPVRRRYQ